MSSNPFAKPKPVMKGKGQKGMTHAFAAGGAVKAGSLVDSRGRSNDDVDPNDPPASLRRSDAKAEDAKFEKADGAAKKYRGPPTDFSKELTRHTPNRPLLDSVEGGERPGDDKQRGYKRGGKVMGKGC